MGLLKERLFKEDGIMGLFEEMNLDFWIVDVNICAGFDEMTKDGF